MTISCSSGLLLAAAQVNAATSADQVLVPLAAALALALVVERVIELSKNFIDALPTTSVGQVVKPATADAADELRQLHEAADSQGDDEEVTEAHPPETIIVQDATDPDNGTTLRAFVLQSVAVIVGIIAARVTDLRLFDALTPATHIKPSFDYLLTGLFIGGGSAPAHALVRFITERRISVPKEEDRAEVPVEVAPLSAETVAIVSGSGNGATRVAAVAAVAFAGAPSVDPDRSLDIPYAGGVDRDRLESIHQRAAEPDLVVFHHTAMPLTSTFEDVVRVIKSRTDSSGKPWVTGYNSVVLADGSIHPFCRWDRYGNHAQGFNRRSLGVTLNGNFDTDPKDRWSNASGRYGPARPTEAQLDAAARVVALWTYLYPDIPVDFSKQTDGIIPHRNVAKKSCPGNMFPTRQFEKLVRHYRDVWERSMECRSRIEAFKLRPYLYADHTKIPPSVWGPPPVVAPQYAMRTFPPGAPAPVVHGEG